MDANNQATPKSMALAQAAIKQVHSYLEALVESGTSFFPDELLPPKVTLTLIMGALHGSGTALLTAQTQKLMKATSALRRKRPPKTPGDSLSDPAA